MKKPSDSQNHNKLVDKLRKYAPKIFDITFSMDMGYEFNAILQEGLIFREPGMLLDHSDGHLPIDEWSKYPQEIFNQKLIRFLHDFDYITPYDQISNEDLIECLSSIMEK